MTASDLAFAQAGAGRRCFIAGAPIVALAIFLSTLGAAASDHVHNQIIDLIAAGQVDQAEALLEETDPTPDDRAFFQGRVLKANGRFSEAAEVFRAILRRDPNYIDARRELAHTLLLMGEYRASAAQFRTLLQIDTDQRLRESYRHFLTVIERERPFGFGAQFALLPSTNINRGTSNTVFDPGNPNVPPFRITSQGESGVGVLLGFSGFYRRPLSPDDQLVFDAGVVGRFYDDDIYNSSTLSFSALYERWATDHSWSFGPYARNTWAENGYDTYAVGGQFAVDRRITDRTSLFFDTRYEERTYPSVETLDGHYAAGRLGLAFSPRPDTMLVGGVRWDESNAASRYQAYDGFAVFARGLRRWSGGLVTGIGLEIGGRGYKDDYPLTTMERQDDFFRLDVSVQNSNIDWRGLTPVVTCVHTINQSNIAFFDYDVTECQIGLTRSF